MSGKSDDIIVNSGLVTYNVVFEDRGISVPISFNPNDMNMLTRLEESQKNIEKATEEIPDDINVSEDSENISEYSEIIKKINDIVYKEIDNIFGNAISKKIFQFCSPLSADKNGITFIERFMNAIAPVMQRDIQQAQAESDKRIAKHIAKYQKK